MSHGLAKPQKRKQRVALLFLRRQLNVQPPRHYPLPGKNWAAEEIRFGIFPTYHPPLLDPYQLHAATVHERVLNLVASQTLMEAAFLLHVVAHVGKQHAICYRERSPGHGNDSMALGLGPVRALPRPDRPLIKQLLRRVAVSSERRK